MCHRCWFWLIAVVFVLISWVSYAQDEINLEDYLQPLDVGRDPKYDQLTDNNTLCSRNCTKYPESRICYYKLVAEQYHAMGPACKNCASDRDDCFGPQCITVDGIERTVLVFNRMIPGPAFHICDGDRVIVDVKNAMPAREVTIHWHGQLQKSSPWEDGVPFVTQCPIASNTMFRYDFYADTSGTHFYHSHSALQLFDGLSGSFIVRTSAKTDPVSNLYDEDLFSHTIEIRDWLHDMIDVRYPGYNKDVKMISMLPVSYLINGMGNYADPASNQNTDTPLAEFDVQSNKKYRFRIISGTSTVCSAQFAIEAHSMLLIAADGVPIQPQMVRSLYLSGADIYDVVVTADQPPRAYLIRIQGYDRCSTAYQQAILRYDGSDLSGPATSNSEALFDAIPDLPELNNVRKPCQNNSDNLCLDELRSVHKAAEKLLGDPDQRFIFEVNSYNFSTEELYDTDSYHRYTVPVSGPGVEPDGGMIEDMINNKSNVFPPFSLLNDPANPLIDQMICPDQCSGLCECLNLIKLGYNNVIEMIFIDLISSPFFEMDHPFHIHGHHFTIMKLGTLEQLTNDPNRFTIDMTNEYPLIKDTAPIPGAGFVIVRFVADNPGFWLLHCHFTAHSDDGMQIVLQVGELEQFPQLPGNWPKCGNYLSPVYSTG